MEWYHPWSNLAPTLTQYMDEEDAVLVCGCGNSELSVDMYDDGEYQQYDFNTPAYVSPRKHDVFHLPSINSSG